jgi:hypothetical protein
MALCDRLEESITYGTLHERSRKRQTDEAAQRIDVSGERSINIGINLT